MKNFISSIFVKTNSVSDEKICIGLFVGGEKKSFFGWSENKLKITTKLISADVYSSLSKSFINLSKDISDKTGSNSEKRIFISHEYSSKYFNYLSNYSKGIVEFKEPKIISKEITEKDFEELFKLYVGESLSRTTKKESKETFSKRVKSYLEKPIFSERTDKFYKVPDDIIGTIYRPQPVDFISCNGNIFAGHAIDFTATPHTVEGKLYEFRALVEGLSMFADKNKFKGKGKYVAYFNEPTEKDQKKILKNALKDSSKHFEMKAVEEIEDAAVILQKGYRKFSSLL